ncbi:General stress protein 69 [Ceratocystis platani]|uniref:General stress protein 69 n=1 Tax=Ceratocystis fimbriata f. sp. platani TaxID=88771 RepID=A0A0F8B6C4_CERFI|nr:General stress protein 69 [Ceratocystis platani]
MGGRVLPRLFSGLWQLSSPAWGAAPQSKILAQFEEYVNMGFTAYDMADHYGDAEVIYGHFRQSYFAPESLYAATKFCVFGPIEVTPKVIAANVTERLTRLQSEHIDLLQFHWQDYSNPSCISAMKLLAADSRVKALGLCNFDTSNMAAILAAGVPIVSNQIQFSLIDSRPTFAMAEVCTRQKVKLLTYGTLCGGFLADKWLDRPEPELFAPGLTPSQRKYFEMIGIWGGWTLFQELLGVLDRIAKKHKVSISNVATRWVLDFDYVGAVLVGTRMGVSGHAKENLKAYGWRLDDEDQKAIEAVQLTQTVLCKPNMSYRVHSFGDHALQRVAVWLPNKLEPLAISTNIPVFWIVFIHGGAWRDPAINHVNFAQPTINHITASLESYRSLLGGKRLGFASLEYRLSAHPDHPQGPETPATDIRSAQHPDHVNDICSGLELLEETYGLSKGQYMLVGHSCGATLAFQTFLEEFRGGIVENHKDSPWAGVYRDFVRGAFGEDEGGAWDDVSPVNFLAQQRLEAYLGVVLCTATSDSLVEDNQRQEMATRCSGLGIEVIEISVEGDHDEMWQIGSRQAAAIQAALERVHAEKEVRGT